MTREMILRNFLLVAQKIKKDKMRTSRSSQQIYELNKKLFILIRFHCEIDFTPLMWSRNSEAAL